MYTSRTLDWIGVEFGDRVKKECQQKLESSESLNEFSALFLVRPNVVSITIENNLITPDHSFEIDELKADYGVQIEVDEN